ncbi:hypothetical protein F5Y15DRAFT_412215 [Xylariaceae sp. FL0016]|nr:hypothetical protein F5Y15DRAFT_412215 [Xylariaceae sp. FL0016]
MDDRDILRREVEIRDDTYEDLTERLEILPDVQETGVYLAISWEGIRLDTVGIDSNKHNYPTNDYLLIKHSGFIIVGHYEHDPPAGREAFESTQGRYCYQFHVTDVGGWAMRPDEGGITMKAKLILLIELCTLNSKDALREFRQRADSLPSDIDDPRFRWCHDFARFGLTELTRMVGSGSKEVKMDPSMQKVLKSGARDDILCWGLRRGKEIELYDKEFRDAYDYFSNREWQKPEGWKGRFKVYRLKA